MRFTIKPFNKNVDRVPYQPEQAVKLGVAMKTGAIPATIGFTDAAYNRIGNPADIVGELPEDDFDALNQQAELRQAGAVLEKDPEPTVATSPAPATSQE